MRIRTIVSSFFLLYGMTIPVFAFNFVSKYPIVAVLIVISSFFISALLLLQKAVLLNLFIAFYVSTVYLSRPYIDVFTSKIGDKISDYGNPQLEVIAIKNFYFNYTDATVVYLSLVTLLLGWFLGLLLSRPKKRQNVTIPNLFLWVDNSVCKGGWSFYIVWSLLALLNYKAASDLWLGMHSEESSPLFAYGLLLTRTIDYVCIFTLIKHRQKSPEKTPWLLMVPIVYVGLTSLLAGSRSYIFITICYITLYWLFLNFQERLTRKNFLWSIALLLSAPLVVYFAILAGRLRLLLRYGDRRDIHSQIIQQAFDFNSSTNPVLNNFYYGITELLHRLSNLKAQFLILNEKFVHQPMIYYNPIETGKRLINSLVPGDIFENVLTINQLFDFIYHGQLVKYNSETWSIQGTLHLYFGVWLAPIIVFAAGYLVGNQSSNFDTRANRSPAFAAFWLLLIAVVLENGTLEKVIRDGIIPPLFSFLCVSFMVMLLRPQLRRQVMQLVGTQNKKLK